MRRWSRGVLVVGLTTVLWFVGGARWAYGLATVSVANDLTTRNVRSEESNLADVFADAIRSVEKSDVAFLPAASFRSDVTVPRGSASENDLLKALEVRDDTVIIMKLTGAQVRKGLEHGLSIYPQASMQFLQVSGITATIDASKDKGSRVVAVKVGKVALVNEKTYTVAMPAPLAHGALAYFKVWSDSTDLDHSTNQTLSDALVSYLRTQRTLGTKGDDRLVIKK